MASAVICLSNGQKFNFSKYIFDSLVRNVDSSSKFYMYPRFIQLIIQNQVGDLSTHTTRFISPAFTQKVFANMRRVGKAEQVQVDDAAAVEETVAEDVSHDAIPSPPPHDIPSPSQEPSSPPQQQQSSPQAPPQDAEIPNSALTSSKCMVRKLEKANKIKSSKMRRLRKFGASRRVESSDDMEDVFNQGRMIDDMDMDEGIELDVFKQGRMIDDIDMDEGIELVKDANITESEGRHAEKQVEIYNLDLDHSSKVLSMQEDDSEVQEVVEVVTTAKLIIEVVTAVASQVSAVSATIPAASATIPAASATIPAAAPTVTPKVKDKGKGILVETLKPMKKKDQIEIDAEYARSCMKRSMWMSSARILIEMLQ
nr:hypothetical protein [Tanacetum cinerariifolium]